MESTHPNNNSNLKAISTSLILIWNKKKMRKKMKKRNPKKPLKKKLLKLKREEPPKRPTKVVPLCQPEEIQEEEKNNLQSQTFNLNKKIPANI